MVRSSKPGKQRKALANASKQSKRRTLRARLATSDPRFAGIRSVTVRVGDTVEVQRGDFGHPSKGKRLGDSRGRAGVKAKVVGIDSSNGKIMIEGITKDTINRLRLELNREHLENVTDQNTLASTASD